MSKPTLPTLFDQLRTEKIETAFVAAIEVSHILRPDDGIEPTPELVESVKEKGVIEPLVLREHSGKGGTKRYTIVSGRRRYLAAVLTGTERVPALLAKISNGQESVLTMTLNRLRAQNFLADIRAYEKLLAQKLSEKEIGDLTGLKQQEIDRRKRLVTADPRIRQSIISGHVKVSVAEAAAKLPPVQQRKLMDQIEESGEKLTSAHIREIKSVQAGQAVAALPQQLFETLKPVAPSGVERFTANMWEMLLEMEKTGMLNVQRPKTGQQVTNARIAANSLIERIREAVQPQQAVKKEQLHNEALARWKREPVAVVKPDAPENDYAERGANQHGVYEHEEIAIEFRHKKAFVVIRVAQDKKDGLWRTGYDVQTGDGGCCGAASVRCAGAFTRQEAVQCEVITQLTQLQNSLSKKYAVSQAERARIQELIAKIEKWNKEDKSNV